VHGLEVGGVLGVRNDLPAERGDVPPHPLRVGPSVESPDGPEQIFLPDDPPSAAEEMDEDLKLGVREIDGRSVLVIVLSARSTVLSPNE
jgi:hypothetical protein